MDDTVAAIDGFARGAPYDHSVVAAALGMPDAPVVPQQQARSLWVNGRLHAEATRYLEYRHARLRTDSAPRNDMYALRNWIGWLRANQRTIHTATVDDWRRFEVTTRWPPDGNDGLPDDAWRNRADALNRFHRWLEVHYHTPSPIPVVAKYHERGRTEGVDHAGGRLAKSSTAVIPLMPTELTELRRAAGAPTPTGRPSLNAQRDRAIVGWKFATGNRNRATTFTTIYEIPNLGSGPIATHHTAAQINKYKRPVTAHAFTSGLSHVKRYVQGERALTAAQPYRPQRPLFVLTADRRKITWEGEHGNRATSRWDQVTDTQRLRLVTPDGGSAVLFLKTTGAPMSLRTLASRIEQAVKNATDGVLPDGVHPHSLRHTYATFLAALYLRRDSDLYPPSAEQLAFRGPLEAVKYVQRNMGHTSDDTTNAYIAHVERLAIVPSHDLKGDF